MLGRSLAFLGFVEWDLSLAEDRLVYSPGRCALLDGDADRHVVRVGGDGGVGHLELALDDSGIWFDRVLNSGQKRWLGL